MNGAALTIAVRRAQLGVAAFTALSAVVGGILLVIGGLTGGSGGMSIPLSVLSGTPFRSFLWPGVILVLVVGGTQVLAVVLQLRRSAWTAAAMAVAGFALVIWMFAEVALLPGIDALQVFYFALGVAQLVLLAAVLGVLPQIAVRPRRVRTPRVRHAL
ncbi:MAG TPA: hypothetical protein VGC45_07275 [Gryllotalpicola sp.]